MVNQDRLVSTFFDLVRIDSPSGGEQEVVDYIVRRLRAFEIEPKVDSILNVIGRFPGKGEPLLMNAHMDSVEPCRGIQPQIVDGIIKSDGTTILGSDDRAGVAAILEALQVLYEDKIPHHPIEVVFSAQEEPGLNGSRALDMKQLKSKMGVVLDSHGPVGTVVVQAPGHVYVDATIIGKAAHSGVAPEKGIHAIAVAADAIAAIPLGRVAPETTVNIGVIKGGTGRNIVPERCEITGEVRSRRASHLKSYPNLMVRELKKAAKKRGAKVEVEVHTAYEGYKFTGRDPIVKLVSEAVKRIGRKPELGIVGGGSDANMFNSRGIAAVPISIGADGIHTTDEWIPVAELVKCAELLVEIGKV
jgi:tripeptide aminopeptidase